MGHGPWAMDMDMNMGMDMDKEKKLNEGRSEGQQVEEGLQDAPRGPQGHSRGRPSWNVYLFPS